VVLRLLKRGVGAEEAYTLLMPWFWWDHLKACKHLSDFASFTADDNELLVRAQQGDTRGNFLFEALAGIVLLGTPHLRTNNKAKWPNALGILGARTESPPKALMDVGALQPLVEISSAFEDLPRSFGILSAYELRKSRVKRSGGILPSTEKLIVCSLHRVVLALTMGIDNRLVTSQDWSTRRRR
jgi:hypothetical protein